jgi:diguanylate cyclase
MCASVQTRERKSGFNGNLCPRNLIPMLNPVVQPPLRGIAPPTLSNGAIEPGPGSVNVRSDLQMVTAELTNAAGDVSMADWDDLLNAIKTRLQMTAREAPYDSSTLQRQQSVEQIQADVLDCVAALEHLHISLTNELAKHKHLKLEIASAQAALARKHVELIGTRAQERRARHMSRHDALTALPNRGYFCQCLDRALTDENIPNGDSKLAVLFLDLDGFKKINDTYGHFVGDQVLKIVAARLQKSVRADDMVGRLGGDEFACLLIGFPSESQIHRQAEKIVDAVAKPMLVAELDLTIRPSIGIAVFPENGLTGVALLKHADAAMYLTKRGQSGFSRLD